MNNTQEDRQQNAVEAHSRGSPDIEIDAHCHCFNGRDMPVFGFFVHLILEYPIFVFVAPFALALARIVEAAPDYTSEKKVLSQNIGNPSALKRVPVNSDKKEELIEIGLRKFIDRDTSFGRAEIKDRARLAENDAFIIYLYKLFGVSILTEPRADAAEIYTELQEKVPKLVQRIINKQQLIGAGELIERTVQFFIMAAEETNYRFQVLDHLAVRYGNPGAKLRVLTPAIVDLEYWLPHADTPTTIGQQAELMELISLIQPPGRIAHGFVAFDPWRYWDDTINHHRINVYDVVRKAIEQQGFFGVKLYPPMGYRALDNASIPDGEFPDELQLLFPEGGVGRKIDDALLKIYQYCADNDVPIMAHCANSIGSHSDYALRAAPDYWRWVLESYPNLRVNLGHFGGIWGFTTPCPNNIPKDTSKLPELWPCQIAAMVDAYDNLYVDVGDFSGVLDRWSETSTTKLIFCNLKDLIKHHPKLKARIMYGTDWALLDREPQNERYYQSMQDHFHELFGATDDFLGRNAARFLGLYPQQQTRRRLEAFYLNKKHPSPFLAAG